MSEDNDRPRPVVDEEDPRERERVEARLLMERTLREADPQKWPRGVPWPFPGPYVAPPPVPLATRLRRSLSGIRTALERLERSATQNKGNPYAERDIERLRASLVSQAEDIRNQLGRTQDGN